MKIILYTLKSELDGVNEKLNFHQHKFSCRCDSQLEVCEFDIVGHPHSWFKNSLKKIWLATQC